MSVLEIKETDEVGRPTSTYLVSTTSTSSERIDILPAKNHLPLSQRLLGIFLPNGYPHTVSSDYTNYQIYDSLQAFASAIAGLLASRAVLQGIGVGDENATATAAMLLSVVQESLGRLATIFFAHLASRRIEAECKTYRLAADVFNDCAFIMDCLSPSLPKSIRVPVLCAASMFRAICGVAGGSSKAILSAHFAQSNNIGELNAKDSSQETIISLLGMWAGGFVVSHVHSGIATWIWLISLLMLHLATNYMAVSSVYMVTLNRQRANILLSTLAGEGRLLTPTQVGMQERIFERDGALRWRGSLLGFCKIGVRFKTLLTALNATFNTTSLSATDMQVPISRLLNVFSQEDYMLWFNKANGKAVVVLKQSATARTELKAWSHALQLAELYNVAKNAGKLDSKQMLSTLEKSLIANNKSLEKYSSAIEEAGWDLSSSLFQTTSGHRICLDKSTSNELQKPLAE